MPLLRSPELNPASLNLQRARDALLGGLDGTKTHVSMFDRDVISFAHGEGVRRPYPSVLAAMSRALLNPAELPIENYMFLQRHDELEAAITSEMCSIGVPAQLARNVVVDAGTSRLIVAALDLMTKPGDTVITFSGHYHPLASWCAYRKLNLITVPTIESDGHQPNADRLETAVRRVAPGRAPVLILFNPSMTGVVCDADLVAQLAEVTETHDMWVIEDALFANCLFEGAAPSTRFAQTQAAERVLTLGGASKLHGLANMRIGWGCGTRTLIDALRGYVTSNAASIPQLAKIAAYEALKAPKSYLRRNVQEVRARLDLVAEEVARLNERLRQSCASPQDFLRVVHPPSAGHSLLLDFSGFVATARETGLDFQDSADLTSWFLKTCRVAFSPAQSHGFDGHYLRVNVASVGTHLSYPASFKVECDWDDAWPSEADSEFEAAFGAGRDVIRSAFAMRIEPAMRSVIEAMPRTIAAATAPYLSERAILGLRDALTDVDAVFMDVWGVLTDGASIFPNAKAALDMLAEVKVPVILVSNTSRRGFQLAEKLRTLGIAREDYAEVVTGGDLAFQCLVAKRVGNRDFGHHAVILGEQPDGLWIEEAGLIAVADLDQADVLLGVGVLNGASSKDQVMQTLKAAAGRDLPFLVTNADSVVRIGDHTYAGSGALAPHYRDFGGETFVFGKPDRGIYDAAAALAADHLGQASVAPESVLVIGDSLATDIAGAESFGARTLLVTASGTHGEDLHPTADGAVCFETLARLCAHHAGVPDLLMRELIW